MFGSKNKVKTPDLSAQLEEQQKVIEELQKKLEFSQAELEAVNTSTHLGIWKCAYDENGNQLNAYYTDEFRRMLGFTRQELPDTLESLGAIIHPDDTELAFGAYGAAAGDKSGRTKYDVEYRIKTKSQGYKWFHAAGECMRWPNGNPREFIGTFSDIDEQKKAAEVFEHDSRRQKAVELMMLEGSWSMDLTKYAIDDPNSPMVFSDQFKKILGYPPHSSDFPDIMSSWITKMHPDDVPEASAAMGKQMSDPSGQAVFDMEYRMKHKNGEYRWVRASSYVVWSDDNVPLMAAGTILDITDEKNNRQRFKDEMEPNIESLSAGIAEIAANVEKATAQMQEVAKKQEEVSVAANGIEEAVTSSMEIIESIQNIASQTNLLSLNAAIEAARAGDAGRGFAVVATEVQSLSSSTQETTEHISEKLTNVNDSVKGILSKIRQIGESIETETEEMSSINSTVEELHSSADVIGKMAKTLYK
ncbi:MAG: PAS domain-containing protein [Lachnospiraceae bacterium]|nr:PAS domain-containing protein [Lachnospiraceae bacterium]